VEIVAEADNGREALQQIAAHRPDLVFLDLQMPVMGGFEVVRKLSGGPLPVITIVTAFDQYAIEAFEAGMIDYLLKPVSQERLQIALERARHLRSKPVEIANEVARIAAAPISGHAAPVRKVVGRNGADYFFVDPEDILAFLAERELVWMVTGTQRLQATETLRAIEDRLKGQQFERVHRNAIVNLSHVRKMSALSSQRWLITLSNSLQLVVSKRQAHTIRRILHW